MSKTTDIDQSFIRIAQQIDLLGLNFIFNMTCFDNISANCLEKAFIFAAKNGHIDVINAFIACKKNT